MNKIFTLSLALALSTPMFAESIQLFKCAEDGIPGVTEPQLLGFAMSGNGRYICGCIENGSGLFIGDCTTGKVIFHVDGEYSSELRGVSNDGVGIGFIDDDGVTYSFDTEEVSKLAVASDARFVLGEGISADGSVLVGSLASQSFDTSAAFSADGGQWKTLPYPSDAELGNLKDRFSWMSAAKVVSEDGSVILGHMGSFTFPTLWVRNEAGEYVPDFFPARYIKGGLDSVDEKDAPLYGMPATYTCMSSNGKYVGLVGIIKREGAEDMSIVPVIYNTQEKTLVVYDEIQQIDDTDSGLYPRAISNDGMFVGTIGLPSTPQGNLGTFVMWPGQTQAVSFLDAFPVFAEKLGESDMLGQNIPTGISGDGKHILGFTYYSDNYDISSDAPAYWQTYVLTLDDNAVEQVSAAPAGANEAIYSIDGHKLSSLTKGLNIIRNSDGSVTKLLKK